MVFDNSNNIVIKSRQQLPLCMSLTKYEDGLILLIIGGCATVEIDFREYRIEGATQLTLLPGSFFRCVSVEKDIFGSLVSFDASSYASVTSIFQPSFSFFLKEYPCAKIPAERLDSLCSLVDEMNYFQKIDGDLSTTAIANIIQNLFIEMYEKQKMNISNLEKLPSKRKREAFEKFITLLRSNCGEHRDVAYYAEQLNITPRYLSYIVNLFSGENVKALIDRHCMQEIQRRLLTTSDTVQEIAIEMRFPDQSFLSRYFKKFKGISPSEFRTCQQCHDKRGF